MLLSKQEISKKLILPEPDVKIKEFYKNGVEHIPFNPETKPFVSGWLYITPSTQGERLKETHFLRLKHRKIDSYGSAFYGEAFISQEIDLTPFKSVSALIISSVDTTPNEYGVFGLSIIYDDGDEYKQLGTSSSVSHPNMRATWTIDVSKITRRGNIAIFTASSYYDIFMDISCPYIFGEYL